MKIAQQKHDSLLTALLMVSGLLIVGTSGFMVIEHWNLVDSLYMTVTTVATVGFGEVHPLSVAGRIFTIILIIAGVGTAAYTFSVIAGLIIEGELNIIRGRLRMDKQIAALHDHTIICGFGRLASIVAKELMAAGEQIIIIERDETLAPQVAALGAPYIIGSASEDETLKAAHLESAKHLLALVPVEAENVYITLTARYLNPNLHITARTDDEAGEKKLRRAGANLVVAPYRVTGARLAQKLIRPHVSEFLEIAAAKRGDQLAFEEIKVPAGSPLAGRTIEQSELRGKTGAFIAAIVRPDGHTKFNPDGKTALEEGCTLIVLGQPKSLHTVSELLSPQS